MNLVPNKENKMNTMDEVKKEINKMTPEQAGKMLEFLRKLDKAYTDYNVPAGAEDARKRIARIEKVVQK